MEGKCGLTCSVQTDTTLCLLRSNNQKVYSIYKSSPPTDKLA